MKFKAIIPAMVCASLIFTSVTGISGAEEGSVISADVDGEASTDESVDQLEATSEDAATAEATAVETVTGEEGVPYNEEAAAEEEVSDNEGDSDIRQAFVSVTGTITAVSEADDDGNVTVTVKLEDESETTYVISKNSYKINDVELAEDAKLTVFVDAVIIVDADAENPRTVDVTDAEATDDEAEPTDAEATEVAEVAEGADEETAEEEVVGPSTAIAYGVDLDTKVVIAAFDENLVGINDELEVVVGEDTEIETADGKEYTGELGKQVLLVTYSKSTGSAPKTAVADKIVVLDIEAVIPKLDVANLPVTLNGRTIKIEGVYYSGDVVMVPVSAVAEKLGFEVEWVESRKLVVVDGYTMTIGVDSYGTENTVPVTLGAAPEIIDGVTYAPITFFSKVVGIETAKVTKNGIILEYTNTAPVVEVAADSTTDVAPAEEVTEETEETVADETAATDDAEADTADAE